MRPSKSLHCLIALGLAGLLLAACTRFFGTPPAPASPLPQATLAPFPTAPRLTPSPTASAQSLPPEGRYATVSEIVNVVEIRASEAAPVEAAVEGSAVGAGGQVHTGGDSRVRLDLNDSAIVRLGADTSFSIEALATDGSFPISLVHLDVGLMWVGLSSGTLQTLTPMGVISMQGSYAIFVYDLGDPNNSDDDSLTVDCFDGPCTVQTVEATEPAGRLERLRLSAGGDEVAREPLTDADVQRFIAFNPEASVPLLAALLEPTATASDETPTSAPATEGATQAATITATLSATPTKTLTPRVTPGSVLGKHTVRAGETLYCIGRAYAVLPDAIARANGITVRSTILVGRVLTIPAVQWRNPGTGPTCVAQFASPYVSGTNTP